MLTLVRKTSGSEIKKPETRSTATKGVLITSLFILVPLALGLVTMFVPALEHGPLVFGILTCGGLGGLLLGIKKSDGSLQFPMTEARQLRLGSIGDILQGAAGAIIIFLLIPYEYPVKDPNAMKIVKLLALALLGGYAGPYLVELGLSRTLASLDRKVDATNQKVAEAHVKLDVLLEKDAEALKLSQKHLSVDTDSVVTEEDTRKLKSAIQDCSQKTQLMIFNEASMIRRDNWSSNESYTRKKIERAIPILDALCKSADEDWRHACYAELGYIHKDKEVPEWKEAHDFLTSAIDLRAKAASPLSGRYELNRAICKIMLNHADNEIKRDLEVAAHYARDKEIIQMLCNSRNGKLAQWMKHYKKSNLSQISGDKDSSHLNQTSVEASGLPPAV